MSSPLFYVSLAIALAGLVVLFLKWRGVSQLGARLAAAAVLGSIRQLETMRAEKSPAWVRSIADAFLKTFEEKDSLRRRAEDRELFQTLLDEISHGFLIVNRDLEIQFANKVAENLFPAPGADENRQLIDVLHNHRLVDVVRDALQGQKRCSEEIQVEGTRPEDEDWCNRVFEIEASPLPNHPESGCWVMVRDITERVITEQVRKDFVANASHELRTPLTLISGYIETLEDGVIDDRETAMHSLGIMNKHSKRIVRIIEDMLTISKLESGQSPVRLEPFDVAECVTDVVENLASLIEEKNAKVEFDSARSDCSMVGDRFYWDQIFMNLIENALKQNQRPGLKVTVSFRCDGENHIFTVTDDGIGIPRADLPYVFKRFYRGAKHHSQEVKGTGLGLSIVKRAVEAHGGQIHVESTPGRATTFTLEVPVLAAEIEPAAV